MRLASSKRCLMTQDLYANGGVGALMHHLSRQRISITLHHLSDDVVYWKTIIEVYLIWQRPGRKKPSRKPLQPIQSLGQHFTLRAHIRLIRWSARARFPLNSCILHFLKDTLRLHALAPQTSSCSSDTLAAPLYSSDLAVYLYFNQYLS